MVGFKNHVKQPQWRWGSSDAGNARSMAESIPAFERIVSICIRESSNGKASSAPGRRQGVMTPGSNGEELKM
ncbi:hypothetical protein Taro_040585, partial [Colocasia esculenta]|nr:hypothetical protein [Colocasia esculenta]